MNKNIYDTDCVTWSPQGRIFQVEYAEEAVKLGTCIVGIKSEQHAIIVALRRAVSKLAEYNDKVLKVDSHCGVTFSGITADADIIIKSLRADCLNHKYVFGSVMEIDKLVWKTAARAQKNTQVMGKRPFGVGFLLAGFDNSGPHIIELAPSGDFQCLQGHAMGGRSQAARTYLETHCDKFSSSSFDELLEHGLKAFQATLPSDQTLVPEALHVGVVGIDREFSILDASTLTDFVKERNLA